MDRSYGAPWSGSSRVSAIALAAALIATILPNLASDARAASQPWSSTKAVPLALCTLDSTPQVCDPAVVHKVRVPQGSRIKVRRLRYEAAETHCSRGRLIIALNGRTIGRTDWVDAGQESTVELLDLTLRRRRNGKAPSLHLSDAGAVRWLQQRGSRKLGWRDPTLRQQEERRLTSDEAPGD